MAGLADAFRTRWPQQPMMQDHDMPVPQVAPQAFDLRGMLQQPTYTPQHHQGFMSPGFADFLHNFYFNQRRI